MNIDLGRVTPLYKGEYSAEALYELNDIVRSPNGALYWYVSHTPQIGVALTDTGTWKEIFSGTDLYNALQQLITDAETDMQGSVTAASGHADRAELARDSAKAWATSESDPEDGKSSARTYAEKASSAQGAAASSANNARASADNALTYAENARKWSNGPVPSDAVAGEDSAKAWANKAQASADEVSEASAIIPLSVRGAGIIGNAEDAQTACGGDLNNLNPNRIYNVSATITSATLANAPNYGKNALVVGFSRVSEGHPAATTQMYMTGDALWTRIVAGGVWQPWHQFTRFTDVDNKLVPFVRGDTLIADTNAQEVCGGDLNNIPVGHVYTVSGSLTESQLANMPVHGPNGLVVTLSGGSGLRSAAEQLYIVHGALYTRDYAGGAWQAWTRYATESEVANAVVGQDILDTAEKAQTVCNGDLNELPSNRIYTFNGALTETDIANAPVYGATALTFSLSRISSGQPAGTVQFFITNSSLYTRLRHSSGWSAWISYANENTFNNAVRGEGIIGNAEDAQTVCNGDLDNLVANRIYTVSATHTAETLANAPVYGQNAVTVILSRNTGQPAGATHLYMTGDKMFTRIRAGGAWTAWHQFASSDSDLVGYVKNDTLITDTNVDSICSGDMDNLPVGHIYTVYGGLTEDQLANRPVYGPNGLTVALSGGTGIRSAAAQMFITTTNLYTRSYSGGAWQDWRRSDGMPPELNILMVGDSIAYGGRNGHRGFVGDLGYKYYNAGSVGARLAYSDNYTENIVCLKLRDYFENKPSGFFQPDVIIASGGINDYGNSSLLGVIYNVDGSIYSYPKENTAPDGDATTYSTKKTVEGGLETLFYFMHHYAPKAQRYFLITHKTYYSASSKYAPNVQNSDRWTQQDLHDVIVAVCKRYGVGVIDVYSESALNTYFDVYRSPTPYSEDSSITNTEYCDSDGVHPTALGYREFYVPLVKKALMTATHKNYTS